MAPGVLSSACLVDGKCLIEPLTRLLFALPSYRSGVRTLTTCQFPLSGGELVSICPTYARFPAQPLCPKFQIRVQYVAPGLVQPSFS
jgi:hypothetical protein